MNRDEGQYFLSHAFDEILMKKKQLADQLATLKSSNTIAKRQSTSVSSQWWLRQQLIAETYTVSCFTWIRIWETFVYQVWTEYITKTIKLHKQVIKKHYSFWRAQFARWVLIALLNWLSSLILLICLGGEFQSWIAQLKKVDETALFTFGTLKLNELLLVFLWTSVTLTKLSWRYGALIL